MDWPVCAIPTYNRCDTITHKTLAFLKSVNYPREKIYLFVVREEYYLYKATVPEDLYGHLVVGVKGLIEQRHFISDYFEEGQIICQFDDDVKKIKSDKTFAEIMEMALKGLEVSGLFGVLPKSDGRCFKDSTTTHLSHILGSFFILRNHRDIRLTKTEKEDMERSILYYKKYGSVLRYRGAGVDTNFRKGVGGLNSEGRDDRIRAEVKDMLHLYPGYVKEVLKKGFPDIQLLWRIKS